MDISDPSPSGVPSRPAAGPSATPVTGARKAGYGADGKFHHPLIPEEPEDINLQNLPADCKPRPLPKGFEGAVEMGKGGGTMSQLKSELHIGCFTTDLSKVRRVLGNGSKASNRFRVNAIDHDSPPLIFAARVKAKDAAVDADMAEICRLLIQHGADVNYTMEGEESPLILASIFAGGVGKVQTVRALIEAGANLRQRDKRHRMTALHWAIISGWHDVVQALIDAGASCSSRGGKDKEDAAELARSRLHKCKNGKATPTGPNDDETRIAELEKIVKACEVGLVARTKEKAEHKAARKAAKKAAGDEADEADSVCAESVCDDLDDWEERGRGTAEFIPERDCAP